MPYFVHVKDDDSAITGEPFESMPDAVAFLKDGRSATHKITFVPTAVQDREWRDREYARFAEGTYLPVPWNAYKWYYPDHYAHMSVKNPGMIAYTKTLEHGVNDRQTSVRPGRYLQEFYKNILSDEKIAQYVAACSAENNTLRIATTADDIERVYTGGPRSCMAHSGSRQSECKVCNRNGDGYHYSYAAEHPTRVYGNSDLALAYYGDIDKASARAIVWPARMIYSRIYGNESVLETLLTNAGYTHGSTEGARVRAIPYNGTYVLPYIDDVSSASVSRCGKWIVLDDRGDLEAQSTSGLAGEVENENDFTCENCDESFSEDDYGGDNLCTDCYRNRYTECSNCGSDFNRNRMRTTSDGDYVCRDCYNEGETDCAIETCSNSFNSYDISSRETRNRRDRGVDALCTDCEDNYTYCHTCEDYVSTETETVHNRAEFDGENTSTSGIRPIDFVIPEPTLHVTCEECNRVVRCRETMDLFSVGTILPDGTFPLKIWANDSARYHLGTFGYTYNLDRYRNAICAEFLDRVHPDTGSQYLGASEEWIPA